MIKQSEKKQTAEWRPAPVPQTRNMETLRAAAAKCTACPLYRNATQTVFGEGSSKVPLMFVGEQPGDQEDLAGHPFIGPAGHLLDRAMADVDIHRELAYVTNAVKHFKWEPRGNRRLHKKPSARDIAACRPWLEAELDLIRPRILVCLGSTAAQSILGPSVRVLRDRGKFIDSSYCRHTFVTVHPSSLLRADDESRRKNYQLFLHDLHLVAKKLLEIT